MSASCCLRRLEGGGGTSKEVVMVNERSVFLWCVVFSVFLGVFCVVVALVVAGWRPDLKTKSELSK